MKKILLICVSSQNVVTFRLNFIKDLQANGYQVSVIAFDDVFKKEIKDLNVDFYVLNDANRSLNPFKLCSLKNKYFKIIKKIAPDIVFTFMLKPNIFGVKAAHKAGVKNIFSMVEGAGDVFINNTFKWKVIRYFVCRFYKKSYKYSKKVFFLNNDDKTEFIERKLVNEAQTVLIPGIGVDLDRFEFKPIVNRATFLMIARMLKTKGVLEYCKAARLVKQKYPDAVFNFLGAEGNIKIADIQEYIDDGSIVYLGTTDDVRPFLQDALLLLLSSYREGMPMCIMEAEAVGRGIITTNNIGCKETVIDGYNGFLIERGDYTAMAEKCIWCIENPEEAEKLGVNARKFAEERFDVKKINEMIMSEIEQI